MKKKRGINELTPSELTYYSLEEKHQHVSSNLIPMQTVDSLRWVRLKHVPQRLADGWKFKQQTKLQKWKVTMAVSIHQSQLANTITYKQALALYQQVSEVNNLHETAAMEQEVINHFEPVKA